VQCVERRPGTIQSEWLAVNLTARNLGKDGFTVLDHFPLSACEPRHITIAVSLLTGQQRRYDVVHALPILNITRLRQHERARTEVMTQRVARKRLRFPSSIHLSHGSQLRAHTEVVQQPVRLEPQQVAPVGLNCSQEWGRCQSHRLEWEGLHTQGRRRGLLLRLIAGAYRGPNEIRQR
jgi:hypothetical protein